MRRLNYFITTGVLEKNTIGKNIRTNISAFKFDRGFKYQGYPFQALS